MKKLFVALFVVCALCIAGEAIDSEGMAANFVQGEVGGTPVRFCDVRKAPFVVTGFPFCAGEDQPLRRLPSDLTKAEVNAGALSQAQCHSGGAVLFRTDSPVIALRASATNLKTMDRMPASGVFGYDLYERRPDGTERFINNTRVKDGTARVGGPLARGMADYILYLPLYSGAECLEIGVSPDASFETPTPQRLPKPIVFYGSSITQGGCASRPANTYTTMICRALDAPQVNLGFSGSACGEPAIARAIATLDASLLVIDYDHNAPSVKFLADTHEPFFRIIREARPDLPVIFISRPDTMDGGVAPRREVIRKTYENAVAAGDRNVYFIDGEALFGPGGQNFCTVDGTHPNDLGFYRMYEGILPVVRQALHLDE